ncbi:hypothetical protein GCM10011519_06930 [Marmoricola endophyticus]|uniref:Uncharacterized protein n=1 Tax=Marmoricola endophyticus TaxID=2040280 RepID=A0A917BBJ6_9ACTN|nr:hypothetical protein [Marmoricola endophyticus]GGF36034.1 hypothetical protein GCM10011519_06930 [Marmoricola endophyticus]
MTWQTWVIGGLAVAVLLLAGYVVALHRRLAVATADTAVPESAPVQDQAPPRLPAEGTSAEVEYLITRVGEPDLRDEEDQRPTVRDSVVLSATLGEPLVKVVALVHGLRRALSPANRNRIGFEVRQEVRRSRKVRRQEMRVAWREMKARERAGETAHETAQETVREPAAERV